MSYLTSKYQGYFILPKDQAQIRKSPNGAVITTVKKGFVCGVATGRYLKVGSYSWYEIYIGNTAAEIAKRKIGFVRHDIINVSQKHPGGSSTQTTTTPATSPTTSSTTTGSGSGSPATNSQLEEAQMLLSELVINDRLALANLMSAYRMAIEYKKRGISVPQSMVMEFLRLWRNIQGRRDYILSQKEIKAKTGTPNPKNKVESDTARYFEDFVRNSGQMPVTSLGALPVLAIVFVAVLASGATLGIAYALRPTYDESKVNLKQSEELKAALAELDPETRDKILADLEAQIDDAYNAGKRAGNWGGMSKILKPAALLLGGYYVVTRFMDREKRRN